jgi:hypothetical protein
VEPLAIGGCLCDEQGKESLHGLPLIHCGSIYKYVLNCCVQPVTACEVGLSEYLFFLFTKKWLVLEGCVVLDEAIETFELLLFFTWKSQYQSLHSYPVWLLENDTENRTSILCRRVLEIDFYFWQS